MINKTKKAIAIICECNPFTEGHKKIINEAKNTYNADYIILLMSGDYVQRGEPSCMDIQKRTKDAINNDADLIIKIPVEYSLSSAKYFATACITILNKLRFVDNIIFGSNINNINILKKYASIHIDTNNKKSSKSGVLYEDIYGEKLSPNDILAVEYIRALNKSKSKIIPLCIKRDKKLKGATELRAKMKHKDIVFDDYTYIFKKIFFDAKLRLVNLTDYYNISDDFNNQILKLDDDFIKSATLDDISKKLATKEKTLANVKRNLMHIILNINENTVKSTRYGKKIDYIHILEFSDKGKELLKYINIPFIIDYTPLSYKALNKNFPKNNIIDKNTLSIKNKSLLANLYADKLYDFIKQKNDAM